MCLKLVEIMLNILLVLPTSHENDIIKYHFECGVFLCAEKYCLA